MHRNNGTAGHMWGQPPSAVRGAQLRWVLILASADSRELALARRPKPALSEVEGAAVLTWSRLNSRALLRDQLPDLLHKLRRRHVLRLLFPTRAHVHLPRLGLFISHHQQERNFLHRVLADLRVH